MTENMLINGREFMYERNIYILTYMRYLVCMFLYTTMKYSKIQVNKNCCNQMSFIYSFEWLEDDKFFVVVLDHSVLSLCLSPEQH